MAIPSKKRDLLSSRRRLDDEGEDEEGIEDVADDSQSEASVLTVDENGMADESDLSEISKTEAIGAGNHQAIIKGEQTPTVEAGTTATPFANGEAVEDAAAAPIFSQTADVATMVNGLDIKTEDQNEEAIQFEETSDQSKSTPSVAEPHLKHTTSNGFQIRGAGRGQPRGAYKPRMNAGNPIRSLPSANSQPGASGGIQQPPTQPAAAAYDRASNGGTMSNGSFQRPIPPHASMTNAKWSHDLHETILAPAATTQPRPPPITSVPSVQPKPSERPSLSKTTPLGNVAARIFLPSMKTPKVLDSKITIRQHTRLPDLRPPLRRDKAVRISIPGQPPKYRFPSVERSFVFIPRAQRPNQQAKLRRGYGSRGGSRRISIHGSVYSPSVAMSRRSSMAGNGILSPTASIMGRPPLGAPTGPSRPVVRLPSFFPGFVPFQSGSGAVEQNYPLPSEPVRREHRSSQMTMHQPRPQKQMSVDKIESDQQPFHQQLPYSSSQAARTSSSAAASRHPSQSHIPTPLQNIPESAINAPAFQPAHPPSQPYYYPPQPMYYYPIPDNQPPPYPYPQMGSPPYMAPPPYFVPMYLPMQDTGDARHDPYMQDNNEMLYYYDPSQYQGEHGAPPPQPMMTPSAEAFYPQQQQQQQQPQGGYYPQQ